MTYIEFNNQKGSVLTIVTSVILVLLILFLHGVFNRDGPIFKKLLNTSNQPSPSITSSPSVVEYSKKLFTGKSNYFRDKPYPQHLLSMSEDNLVGIKCNRPYKKEGEEYKPYPEMTEIMGLNDIQMKIVEKINSQNKNNTIYVFALCQDEALDNYLLYGLEDSKASPYPVKPKVAYLSKDLEVLKNVDMPFEGYYGGCYTALQLTKDSHLYIQCNDGDGQFSIASIYNLDLSSGEVKLNASCQTKPVQASEESDGMGSKVVCSSTE